MSNLSPKMVVCALMALLISRASAAGANGEECIFNDSANIGGCTAGTEKCHTVASGLLITSYAEWRTHCLSAGKCTCKTHAGVKFLRETTCYTDANSNVCAATNAPCTVTATGVAATAACTTGCKCLVITSTGDKPGCLKHSDCAKDTTSDPSKTAKCYSVGGVEITDANASILCSNDDCVCKAQADVVANAGLAFTGGAACTNDNQCAFATDACVDKNGVAHDGTLPNVASQKCRLPDAELGCLTHDHCKGQLCLQYGVAGRVAHGKGGGVCVATGANGKRCAFHGIADKYATGCSDEKSLCVTSQGVVLADKAAYLQSRCLESPTECSCQDVSVAIQQTAGSVFTSAGGAGTAASVGCHSGLLFDISDLTVKSAATVCTATMKCVCLVEDKKECTASAQCRPTSTCYKHKLSAKLGICLDTEDNWNNTTLDAIETFDHTTLMTKLTSVETNLASGTTAQTGTLQTAVTASETAISGEVAKVKTDVGAVNAKMALETTAQKVKKDVSDTEDKVGGYGIAAVVLVAIILVAGVVLSFSAAGKGTKLRSSSSSRQRGRRQEESEGESST